MLNHLGGTCQNLRKQQINENQMRTIKEDETRDVYRDENWKREELRNRKENREMNRSERETNILGQKNEITRKQKKTKKNDEDK